MLESSVITQCSGTDTVLSPTINKTGGCRKQVCAGFEGHLCRRKGYLSPKILTQRWVNIIRKQYVPLSSTYLSPKHQFQSTKITNLSNLEASAILTAQTNYRTLLEATPICITVLSNVHWIGYDIVRRFTDGSEENKKIIGLQSINLPVSYKLQRFILKVSNSVYDNPHPLASGQELIQLIQKSKASFVTEKCVAIPGTCGCKVLCMLYFDEIENNRLCLSSSIHWYRTRLCRSSISSSI